MSEFDIAPTAEDSDDKDGDEASSDTEEEVSPLSPSFSSSLQPVCPSLIVPLLFLPEQIVNEYFLLCRRQDHSHSLSASTDSVSNGCD